MDSNTMLALTAFIMATSLVLLVATAASGRGARVEARLKDLSGAGVGLDEVNVSNLARAALPRMGRVLTPGDEKDRKLLSTRLVHAGLYSRQAMPIFLGVKLLLIVGPVLSALAAAGVGLVPPMEALLYGAIAGIAGVIGPSFWLDARKRKRQVTFRRALPDALDVLVICLEGGLSLPSALRRVAEELQTAHPVLALELNVVQREIQLGRTPGEALQKMGERTDLEEMRSLASVILQADRFGAGLVRSLRVHAETLRTKRLQRAEELAQKAATKLLFPTILFIFPAVFVVILGPAAIHLLRIFGAMGL